MRTCITQLKFEQVFITETTHVTNYRYINKHFLLLDYFASTSRGSSLRFFHPVFLRVIILFRN